MPTNVTAEYKKAEQAFRQAREPRERLVCLKEMLRTIPKHKGTEHLQADIKTRIKQLTDELSGSKKSGSRTAAQFSVRPEGAAQVCLIGPPNSGKSSLHARLTGSHTTIASYAYTTKLPVPGMLPFEDTHFQWVALPPASADYLEAWFVNALQPADAALLVIDLSDPGCIDHVLEVCKILARKGIILEEQWPGFKDEDNRVSAKNRPTDDAEQVENPFRICLPTAILGNKSDLDPEPDELNVLEDLLGIRFPALATSAQTGFGLGALGALLFEGLEIVRVYTKAPGQAADQGRPFTVRRGDTIRDVARLVHKDFSDSLKFARVWGSGQFDGQHVGSDHPVADGDLVELHMQ